MKRLFRKWLKRQIIKTHNPMGQRIFEWIYGSSILTWKDKLFSVKNDPDFYSETYDWLIDNK